MLKDLFESSFYRTFPIKEGTIINLEHRLSNTENFTLRDDEACKNCRFACVDNFDNRVQLNVKSTTPANYISIGQVFSYVEEPVGEICDYMIECTGFTSLVEMSCAQSEYVKNKRQKARRQLLHTISLLRTNEPIREHIDSIDKKYAVFSWRETFNAYDGIDDVEKNMLDLTVMADEVYSPNNEMKFEYGYKYKEIRYPDYLICS